jgi:hypothetical protein
VRVVIYALILVGLTSALVLLGGKSDTSEITVLRGQGAPFSESGDQVINQLRLKVRNRTDKAQRFEVQVVDFPAAKVVAPELPLALAPTQQGVAPFFVVAPRAEVHGTRRVQIRVSDGHDAQLVPYTLLGP